MKYLGAIIVLATAFTLSGIAAFMSITGMMALFAAHQLVVGIMMGTLETGKVVASGWLKFYWTDRVVPLIHKIYLIVATIVLMVITCLGIFGFLSAGHLEQTAPLANVSLQTSAIEQQIDQKKSEVTRLESRVALLDKNVEAFLQNDKASGGLRATKALKSERDQLQGQITADYDAINKLNIQLLPFKQQTNEVEAKLGPVKYVAALFGWQNPETAVRFIIVMIIAVFDPLAIVLMISGLISIKRVQEARVGEVVVVPATIEDTLVDDEPVTQPLSGAMIDKDYEQVIDIVEEEEPEVEEYANTPEDIETFNIVQSLHDNVTELEEHDRDEMLSDDVPDDAEIEVIAPVPLRGSEDHRERLIRLLQAEPDFLAEVEQVIEQIAAERVALKNDRNIDVQGGYTPPEKPFVYGVDHNHNSQ